MSAETHYAIHGPGAQCIQLARAVQDKVDAEAFRDPDLFLHGLAEELRVHPE